MNTAQPQLSRAMRRQLERFERRKPVKEHRTVQRDSIRLALMPWNIDAVWRPLEAILDRMAIDGTIETAQGKPILYDAGSSTWYEVTPAIGGLIDFHEIAAARHGWKIDLSALQRFANKLKHAAPIFDSDLSSVRTLIDKLRRLDGRLTLGEAKDILTTVRLQIQFSEVKRHGGAA